ncbi:hypothetical protein DSO57_1033731, partial [Entomophthora muscae]
MGCLWLKGPQRKELYFKKWGRSCQGDGIYTKQCICPALSQRAGSLRIFSLHLPFKTPACVVATPPILRCRSAYNTGFCFPFSLFL